MNPDINFSDKEDHPQNEMELKESYEAILKANSAASVSLLIIWLLT